MGLTLRDDPARGRFEAEVEGGTAFALYRLDGDRVVLTHTEVPRAVEGRGIGGALVRAVLDRIRADGRKVVPRYSFAATWIARHPEYRDLLA